MPKVFAASLKTGKVKNSGVLIIQDDGIMRWDPKNGEGGFLTPLKNVEKLFASQPTKPNHLLKLTCQINSKTDDYMFAFADRSLLEKVKTELQAAIKEQREGSIAKSDLESKKITATSKLDNKSLLENFQLQHQILKENKELAEAFRAAVIENGLSPESFWSTRLHILRPHAMLYGQKRGAYNVLGDIKPTTSSDNQIKISVTREQIHDIFEQYPIVQQAYTENVPNLSENLFWQRFFMSKLFRRLRGEKISTMDAPDALLDQYLTPEGNVKRALTEEEVNEGNDTKKQRIEPIIPSYINIEGNEENQETTAVNVPDITMQPGKSSKDIVSLIRSMNGLSKRMLHIHNGIEYQDKDESTLRDQLTLQDLEGPSEESRYIDLDLVNDETAFERSDVQRLKNAAVHISPEKLDSVRSAVSSVFDLQKVRDPEHVAQATQHIISLEKQRFNEEAGHHSYPWIDSDQDNSLMSKIVLCHAASMEFLKQFWLRFQSGDPSQTATLSNIVKSLRKSSSRVDAVINSTDDETKRRQVAHVFSNMLESINTALLKYDRAIEAANEFSNGISNGSFKGTH